MFVESDYAAKQDGAGFIAQVAPDAYAKTREEMPASYLWVDYSEEKGLTSKREVKHYLNDKIAQISLTNTKHKSFKSRTRRFPESQRDCNHIDEYIFEGPQDKSKQDAESTNAQIHPVTDSENHPLASPIFDANSCSYFYVDQLGLDRAAVGGPSDRLDNLGECRCKLNEDIIPHNAIDVPTSFAADFVMLHWQPGLPEDGFPASFVREAFREIILKKVIEKRDTLTSWFPSDPKEFNKILLEKLHDHMLKVDPFILRQDALHDWQNIFAPRCGDLLEQIDSNDLKHGKNVCRDWRKRDSFLADHQHMSVDTSWSHKRQICQSKKCESDEDKAMCCGVFADPVEREEIRLKDSNICTKALPACKKINAVVDLNAIKAGVHCETKTCDTDRDVGKCCTVAEVKPYIICHDFKFTELLTMEYAKELKTYVPLEDTPIEEGSDIVKVIKDTLKKVCEFQAQEKFHSHTEPFLLSFAVNKDVWELDHMARGLATLGINKKKIGSRDHQSMNDALRNANVEKDYKDRLLNSKVSDQYKAVLAAINGLKGNLEDICPNITNVTVQEYGNAEFVNKLQKAKRAHAFHLDAELNLDKKSHLDAERDGIKGPRETKRIKHVGVDAKHVGVVMCSVSSPSATDKAWAEDLNNKCHKHDTMDNELCNVQDTIKIPSQGDQLSDPMVPNQEPSLVKDNKMWNSILYAYKKNFCQMIYHNFARISGLDEIGNLKYDNTATVLAAQPLIFTRITEEAFSESYQVDVDRLKALYESQGNPDAQFLHKVKQSLEAENSYDGSFCKIREKPPSAISLGSTSTFVSHVFIGFTLTDDEEKLEKRLNYGDLILVEIPTDINMDNLLQAPMKGASTEVKVRQAKKRAAQFLVKENQKFFDQRKKIEDELETIRKEMAKDVENEKLDTAAQKLAARASEGGFVVHVYDKTRKMMTKPQIFRKTTKYIATIDDAISQVKRSFLGHKDLVVAFASVAKIMVIALDTDQESLKHIMDNHPNVVGFAVEMSISQDEHFQSSFYHFVPLKRATSPAEAKLVAEIEFQKHTKKLEWEGRDSNFATNTYPVENVSDNPATLSQQTKTGNFVLVQCMEQECNAEPISPEKAKGFVWRKNVRASLAKRVDELASEKDELSIDNEKLLKTIRVDHRKEKA
jgi:hypothetical protein